MVSIVINLIASIISGMMLFLLQYLFKKKQKQDEIREKRNHKKDILIIKSINAIGDLTLANAIAIRDGKTNGELKHALKEYEVVNKEITDFVIENSCEGE